VAPVVAVKAKPTRPIGLGQKAPQVRAIQVVMAIEAVVVVVVLVQLDKMLAAQAVPAAVVRACQVQLRVKWSTTPAVVVAAQQTLPRSQPDLG
jgi:hypothetical protein